MKRAKAIIAYVLLALTASLGLMGCSETPENQERIKNTVFQPRTYGQAVELDGCLVQMHQLQAKNFFPIIVATAKCPTATVTATNQDCGKNCLMEQITVKPNGPAVPLLPASTGAHEVEQRRAQARAELGILLHEKKRLEEGLKAVETVRSEALDKLMELELKANALEQTVKGKK